MEGFYPSEVARLVLGYLNEEKCLNSWQTFLEESSNLEEYCHLYKKGKVYSTNVNGHSLLDILNEYCVLKSMCNDGNKIESSKQTCPVSESEFLEAIRKDVFLETTKSAMDFIFQKYFSSSVLNIQNDPSSNSSSKVDLLKPRNINFRKDKFGNSCIAHESGLIVEDKQNTVSDIANEVINKITNERKNKKCHANKSDISVTISKQNRNGALEKLNNHVSEEQQRTTVTVNNSAGTSVENASVLRSECTVKKFADSSTESIVEDDEEIEIIKEIKIGSLNHDVQNNQNVSCPTDLMASNTIPVIDIETNDSEVITSNQTTSVHNTITNVDNSKQVNLTESNSVRNTQENNKSPAGINQAVIHYDSVEVNQINSVQHTVNASNDQSSYNINTTPFLSNSAATTKTPLTTPRYNILPGYSLNGSLANNNQLYILLNPPVASNLSGTYVTAPQIQTNVPNPALPPVSTTFAETSVAAAVSNLPPIAPAGKRLVTGKTRSVKAPKKFPTTSNVSESDSTPEIPGTARRSVANLRGNKRVSYVECLENESDTDESYSSKSDRKRKIQKVASPKSKTCSSPPAIQFGKVQASTNKEHNTEINDSLISTVSVSPGKHKRKKKKKKSKTSEMNKGKNKKSKPVAIKNYSQQLKLVPSDYSSKEVLEVTKSIKDSKYGIPVSSCSDNHDKLQSVNSKRVPENVDQLPRVNKNRVLRVVLSDVLQKSKSDAAVLLHNQCEQRKEKGNSKVKEDQINSKQRAQCRRSPRKQKEDAKHSDESNQKQLESKSTDTTRPEMGVKVTVPGNSSIVTAKKRKLLPKSKSTDTTRPEIGLKVTVPGNSSIATAKRKLLPQLKSTGRKKSLIHPSVHVTPVPRLITFHPKSFPVNNVNFENSFKNVTANIAKPKLFQKAKAIQDKYGNIVCIKMPKNNSEEYRIFMTKNRSLLSSHAVENNLKCSTNESNNNNQDPLTIRSSQNSKNIVSNQITILPESVISVSGNPEFEKFDSLPEKLSEKSDVKQNCGTGINQDSSNPINVQNEIAAKGHDEEKKLFLTNSISSLHQVNVSTRLETCVAKKLNFDEKVLDYNSRPIINESFFSANNNNVAKEEDSTKSSSEILTGESGTFSVNINSDSSNFISHRAETSVFSVLTSISSNTKVLDIVETRTVTKPHSDLLSVSSIKQEENQM